MTEPEDRSSARRRRGTHVLALVLLCAVVFFPGLDRHGVTNWQEAQRLIVAREMQDRYRAVMADKSLAAGVRELLVPRANGRPYLAKPPVIYWSQIALAGAMGQRVELWHLRAVVAIAGLLGVLTTYGCARELLSPDHAGAKSHSAPLGPSGVRIDSAWVDRAAFWSAAMLATGLLYVRSGRIGELDILLVPFCTVAIWMIARAWRAHRERRETDWPVILIAAATTALATLSKDPGVMVVGLASYGGIGLWAAFAKSGTPVDVALLRDRGRAPLTPLPTPTKLELVAAWILAGLFAIGAIVASSLDMQSPGEALGVLIIGALAGLIGLTLGRLLFWPLRFRAMFTALSRTHPLLVIGGAVLVRLAWGWAVAGLIGTEATGSLVRQEVEDNVRPFMPEAPLNNLEAISFGVGVGSVAAIITAVVLLTDRFQPSRTLAGWYQLAAWLLFTFLAFSVLGKGVQRYLTPMWPAIAILGGVGIATALRAIPRPRWLLPALTTAVLALAIGQGWWYGYGRERAADRSPRDMIAELKGRGDLWMYRLFSFEFATPALDYYADRRVQVVGDPRINESMAGGGWWTIERLIESIRRTGRPAYGLIRTGRIPGEPEDAPTAIQRLEAAGLIVRELPTDARFRIDKGRSEVRCYKVRLPRPGELPTCN